MVQFFSRTFSYEYVSYLLCPMSFIADQVGVDASQASVVARQHGPLEKIPKPALCTCPLSRVRLLSSDRLPFDRPSCSLPTFGGVTPPPFPAFFARATLTATQNSVLERSIDPETGIIRTERVIGCTQKAPSWIVKVSRSPDSRRAISVVT